MPATEFVLAVSAQILVVEWLGYVDGRLPDLRPAPVAPVGGDLAGGPAEDRLVLLDDGQQRVAVVGVAQAERPDDPPARAAPGFSVTVSETLLRFATPPNSHFLGSLPSQTHFTSGSCSE